MFNETPKFGTTTPVDSNSVVQENKTPQYYALEELRIFRDALLAETDWVVIKYTETGSSVPVEWINYRQALRDLPSNNSPAPIHEKYGNLDWSKITLPKKPE